MLGAARYKEPRIPESGGERATEGPGEAWESEPETEYVKNEEGKWVPKGAPAPAATPPPPPKPPPTADEKKRAKRALFLCR